MRVLITGGNGFLGSNLIDLFIKLNYQLLVVSKNNNNIKGNLDKIKFIRYDSSNYNFCEQAILEFNPEVVIHLAWYGGSSYYDINDINQIYQNISPSLSLLEICSKQDIKPVFIGFGSFAEYGNLYEKATEYQQERPNSFYGLSKNIYKSISKMYCDQKEMDWIWIRPCYIYGRKDAENRLIPSVINKKLNGEKIYLDSCNKIIDYLHIEDFCSAILEIINKKCTGVFNICSGKEYILRDILNLINLKIESNSEIIYDSKLDRVLAPNYICGSNNRLIKETGWSPKVSIEQGLIETINYYKSKLIWKY